MPTLTEARITLLQKKLEYLNLAIDKAWSDEARAASLEARRAKVKHLHELGDKYIKTGEQGAERVGRGQQGGHRLGGASSKFNEYQTKQIVGANLKTAAEHFANGNDEEGNKFLRLASHHAPGAGLKTHHWDKHFTKK